MYLRDVHTGTQPPRISREACVLVCLRPSVDNRGSVIESLSSNVIGSLASAQVEEENGNMESG